MIEQRLLGLLLATSVLFVGCGVRFADPEVDGPGADFDASALPAVVPRNEPLSRYGNPDSYEVFGRRYHVRDSADGYVEEGVASWYGSKFHGRRTSSGETYDMYALTAAHRTLPLPTYVRVTHLDSGRSLVVRVNDRGPFHDNRIIDLSYAAATRLGVVEAGTARVRVEALPGGTPIPRTVAIDAVDDASGPAYIQVGAFGDFANAQSMRARVAGADIRNVNVTRVRNSAGTRVYRVRIGPLKDADERQRILARLRNAGIDTARVVRD